MKRLTRRTLLGAMGATVGLPYLEAFGQAASFPKRLVIVFTANGTIASQWKPSGSVSNFTLSRILRPLEAHKQKLLVLDGIDCESANHGPGSNAHDLSMGHLLTGTELVPGPQGVGEFGHLVDGSAGGPSVDQFIASKLNAGTRFQSIEFGVRAQNIFMPLPSRLVYKAQFQPVQPENNPQRMFDRLFGGTVNQDPNGAQRLKTKRQLVIDQVKGEFSSLSSTVSAEDKKRLDAHAQSLFEVEKRALTVPTFSCSLPTRPASGGDYRAEATLQMDLMVKALACDLTRVATFQWSTAQSGATFPWLGFPEYHHELSHAGDSDAAAQEKLVKINEWYAGQFAALLDKMDAVKEGDGTMLDHSCVVWINELSKGNNHSHNDVPVVMAGSLSGHFRTGRFLSYAGKQPHNNLMLSWIQAMGVQATTFGNPAYCSGPLSNLTM